MRKLSSSRLRRRSRRQSHTASVLSWWTQGLRLLHVASHCEECGQALKTLNEDMDSLFEKCLGSSPMPFAASVVCHAVPHEFTEPFHACSGSCPSSTRMLVSSCSKGRRTSSANPRGPLESALVRLAKQSLGGEVCSVRRVRGYSRRARLQLCASRRVCQAALNKAVLRDLLGATT